MVAGDGYRVEFRHVLRELGGIDVGVAHHELLEDIVLNGTCHFFKFGSLLKTGIDVECEYREHCAIHGHRYRHFVQWNAVEENLHVVDRADRHTGFAHITNNAFVVGIIAAMCSKVKCYRKSLLARGEVASVKSVGLGGCREAGILAYCPGTHGVHATVGTTEVGRKSCDIVQVLHSFEIFFGIDALYGDKFWGKPIFPVNFGCGRSGTAGCRQNIDVFEIGFHY